MINNLTALSSYSLIVLVWKKADIQDYDIKYKITTDIDYTVSVESYNGNTYAISNLEPNKNYEVIITDNSDASENTIFISTTKKIAPCNYLNEIAAKWGYNQAELDQEISNLESIAFGIIQNKVTDIYRSVNNLNAIIGMIKNYVMANLIKNVPVLNQNGESNDEYAQFYTQLNELDDSEEYQKKQTGQAWVRYSG